MFVESKPQSIAICKQKGNSSTDRGSEQSIQCKMSSWIKLIDHFNKTGKRKVDRSKRLHREIETTTNIEDDDSSQENFELTSTTSSSVKRRKVKPLENLTIENAADSSDECCDVEYNPDGNHLPSAEKRKIKKKLPVVVTSTSHQSSIISDCTTESQTFTTTSKSNAEKANSPLEIDESLSDSDSTISDKSSTHTLIDESSTDSSIIQSPIVQQHETMIETQDSITPPVAPFIATTVKLPKKRKLRVKKGGMVERLQKSLSQAKSNLLFWQHHRSAELIPPGILVTVSRVENTYGRTFIHTKVNDEEIKFIFCSKTLVIEEGDVIEVKLDTDRGYVAIDNCVMYPYVDKVLLIRKENRMR